MFKFGFSTSDDEHDGNTKPKTPSRPLKESKEIKISEVENLEKLIEECETNSITCDNLDIKYLSSVDVVLNMINTSVEDETHCILQAEQSHSDLVSGIYEGGLKIWECTYDILNFIEKNKLFEFSCKKVLDLGCGTGIIGILCAMKNASCYFQDYNEEVIQHITIPNFLINNKNLNKEEQEKCKFFAGDWCTFSQLVDEIFTTEGDRFDYIFTCETIYNPVNYEKLHDIFKRLLKKDGLIYLAAKTYYFGVGGGLSDFKDFLVEKNVFKFTSVWKNSVGLEREILEIKFNK